MSKQLLNLGTVINDGTGDNLRTGGQKINDNFNEIYGVNGLLKSNGLNSLIAAIPGTDYQLPLIPGVDYLVSFTETDPIFQAWDKSTGISITESQISDLKNYLTSINGLTISSLINDFGYITSSGSIIGNAATATILQTSRSINGILFNGSSNITVPVNSINDISTTSIVYPLWTNTTGNNQAKISTSKLSFVPSTGILTAIGFIGSGSGLTSLAAENIVGTLSNSVLANSILYVGTTAIELNRASNLLALTGISSVNGISLIQNTIGFSILGGTVSKTLTVLNSLSLSGTDGSTLNIGTGGTLGTAAFTASTAYQPSNTNLTSLAGLTYVSPSFVKMTASGTFALDTNTYATTSSLSSYVPYTGATGDVDLGLHNLTVDIDTLFVDSVNHRVGIGTVNPLKELHVVSSGSGDGIILGAAAHPTTGLISLLEQTGGAGTGGDIYLRQSNNAIKTKISSLGDSYFSTGNVGIGTTGPEEKLHIKGNDIYIDGRIENENASGSAGFSFKKTAQEFKLGINASNNFRIIDVTDSNKIPFAIEAGAGANALYIKSGGNVGIGTTSPTALLHLKAGTVSNAPFKLTGGISLTTPQTGALEFNGVDLLFTPISTRYPVTLSKGTSSQFIKGDGSLDSSSYYNKATDNSNDIIVENISGSTYTTLQDFINLVQSAGRITGGIISEYNITYINVSAGSGWVRILDDDISTLKFFNWPEVTNLAIAIDTINQIYVDYNSGSPQIMVDTIGITLNLDTQFPLGIVSRDSEHIHIINNPFGVSDSITNIIQRFDSDGLVKRDNATGGLILGETGTRNIVVTAGKLWSRLNDFNISSIDTSSGGVIDSYYRDGLGGWIGIHNITQWDNIHFDNNSGTLATIANNKWSNLWFYMESDGDLIYLYGQDEYITQLDASNAPPPSSIPPRIQSHGLLIGRLIFKVNATTAASIDSAFSTVFTSYSISTHNNLSGLQGGTTDEFYHLTNAQLGIVTNTSGINTGDETTLTIKTKLGSSSSTTDGYLTSANWNTFNNKQAPLTGTGIVKSTAGSISYLTDNSANWNSAYTFTNGFSTNYPDLIAIESLVGLTGLLKKTAANTWTLDTSTYITGINSSMITTALGYIPYDSSNPSGYTTNTGTITDVSGVSPIISTGGTTPVISIIAATASVPGSMSAADKLKLDNIAENANNYSLPAATSTVIGGVELFSDIQQTVASNGVSSTASRTYGIQINSSGQLVVNVPWVDTNTIYTHPTGDGNLHVPATSTTNNGKFLMAGSTAGSLSWGIPTNTTYTFATGTTNGTFNVTPSGGSLLAVSIFGLGSAAYSETTDYATAAHELNTSNPHAVTKTQVGLGNVENTALSTWAGSANITEIGTLISGTVPWDRLSGIPSYAASDQTMYIGTTAVAINRISGALALTGITSIDGTAAKATILATARTINGTSFNGSANITTANWGTARTITIGSTGKSVNGSANVSWSLVEIGAQAAGSYANEVHTHIISDVTDLQTTLDGKQPLDADLTSIAGLIGASGLLRKTALNTWSLDTNTYLTSYTETDPIFVAHTISNVVDGTGFLKNTAGVWSYDNNSYSLTSHLHTGVYEPVFTKNTGFNKNFGTTAGTVSEGNHVHTFASLTSKPTTLSGYGITDAQSLDADLTAIAGLVGTSGFLKKTAANTWELIASELGTGTVTSVALTAPTGFSVSGSPITASGTLTLSFATGYSLPTTAKQTNWDTAYTNTHISGSDNQTITSGNGMNFTSGSGNVTITLGTPETITTATTNSVSSTGHTHVLTLPATMPPSAHTLDSHSNVTITTNSSGEILKWNGTAWINNTLSEAGIATATHVHGNITNAGAIGSTEGLIIKTTTSGVLTTLSAGVSGQYLQYNGTWATPPNTIYTLPTATNLILGGVKIGSGITITSGTISVSTAYAPDTHVGATGSAHGVATISVNGFMSSTDKTKLDGIAASANNYVLPVATSSILGGVKSGTDITIDASGNVSVNDDSHNHIISNIDGLQTALDGKSATTHNHTLDSLSNITITTIADGELLVWDTTTSEWINQTLAEAGIAISSHTHSTFDRASSVLSGGNVFSNIVVTDGIVTAIATRTLSYTDVGAASSTHDHAGVYQPLDADLTAIAGLVGTVGLLKKTAADTWTLDTTAYTTNTGTVTSIAMTVPTGLSIAGTPITTSGTLALTYASGYAIPTTAKQTQWDTAYTHSQSAHQTIINGTGFVKASGTTLSYDNNTYSLSTHNHTLDSLSNVTITTNSTGEILKWNGTSWINNTLAEAGIASTSSLSTHTSDSTIHFTQANISITESQISDFGSYQPLDADLTAIAALTGTTGLLKKTAADTWTLDTTAYTTNTGTVTSVAVSVPTGLSVTGTPVTTSGTIAISLTAGYSIPTTANQTNWTAAYNDKINSTSFDTGTGVLTLTQQDSGTITVDLDGRYLESFTETDPIVGAINGIVKSNGSGTISSAVSGTDYEVPLTFSTGLTRTTNSITVNYGTTTATACSGNDSRLSDSRTPTDNSVTYTKVDETLKTAATVTSSVDLSANGIGNITLSANTAFSFSNYELNKTYMLVITANGFTPSFATAARHVLVEGNAVFSTTGVFYVGLTCIDATTSSEKLLTTIMKGA